MTTGTESLPLLLSLSQITWPQLCSSLFGNNMHIYILPGSLTCFVSALKIAHARPPGHTPRWKWSVSVDVSKAHRHLTE